MDFKEKSETLADKMNKITSKFIENLDIAEEIEISGNDIINFVEEKTQDITLYNDNVPVYEIINLENMVDDFKFVRETLKENTENGRRVLNSITLDLLNSDDDKRASLIMSFAELNRAVADNIKLYIQSYKEISTVLLNLDKIKKEEQPKVVNNTLNLAPISTVDLIQQLQKL